MPKLNMSFPFLASYTRRRFQQLHHVLAEVLLNPLKVSTEQKGLWVIVVLFSEGK